MKILLVQSYLGRQGKDIVLFPIGLAYIADHLEKHEVRVLDMNVCDNPYDDLAKDIKEFKPDVVGISLRNIDSCSKRKLFYYYKELQPTVSLIKDIDKNVLVILGGSGYSIFAKEIMDEIQEIDYGVHLEGEESFPELLNNLDNPEKVGGILYRENGEVVFTQERPFLNFKDLPIPSRKLFQMDKYPHTKEPVVAIQTKRGCPLKCSYCIYPFLVGRKLRNRTPNSVVDEIEYLSTEYNVKTFMIADSVFNLPKNHAEEICREIIRRDLKVKWTAYFELGTFTEEMMNLAIESGCYLLGFSPDAVSDVSLKSMGKIFKEKDIYEKLQIIRKAQGVKLFFEFFCTPPSQNFMGFLKTVKMYLYIHIIFFGRGGAAFNWVRVLPNTPMYQTAIDDGIIKSDSNLLPDDEKDLSKLFYSCPQTRLYADPFFSFISYMKEKAGKLSGRKRSW